MNLVSQLAPDPSPRVASKKMNPLFDDSGRALDFVLAGPRTSGDCSSRKPVNAGRMAATLAVQGCTRHRLNR